MSKPTFVYDSQCQLCTGWMAKAKTHGIVANWVPANEADNLLAEAGLPANVCDDEAVCFTDSTHRGSDAIAALLQTSPRRRDRLTGRLMMVPGLRAASHAAYRRVARRRHR